MVGAISASIPSLSLTFLLVIINITGLVVCFVAGLPFSSSVISALP